MSSSAYERSWNKTWFLSKLLLFLESRDSVAIWLASTDPEERAAGYSALASTYHSIYGTAGAQLRATLRPWWLVWLAPVRLALWCITWLPLGAWCYLRALPLSNKVVELIGYEGMTADMCDTRQSILFFRGRYGGARTCIRAGLKKIAEAHTRGLLCVGLAEIYEREGNWYAVEIYTLRAISAAEEAEKEEPLQAARIYRHCASLIDFFEINNPLPGNQLRRRARALLQEAGAKDQLLKIR